MQTDIESLPADQVAQLQAAFNLFDKSGCGSITVDDLGAAMRSLGHNPTDQELKDIVEEVDQDGNGSIEFDEFVQMILLKLSRRSQKDEIRDTFKMFDKNADGYISKEELSQGLLKMGITLTPEELEDMVTEADIDRDGLISYEDFVFLMTSGAAYE